jgi:fibronectin-binding autotransporter adhesin
MKFPNRAGTPLLAAFAIAALTLSTRAATKTYIGTTTGHFNVSSNWSPSGAPAAGDDVILGTTTYTATDDLDVTLDTSEPTDPLDDTLNSLTLDSSGLRGFMVLNQTSGILTVTTETIGKTTAENTFNQGAGTTNQVETLNIGVAGVSDTYTLSGNVNVQTILFAGTMNVGISGTGTFTQTGGTFDGFGLGSVTLGVNSGGSGTVNLSGSQSEFIVGVLNVAGAGTGIFNQSSGSDVSAEDIFITSTSGTATYNYSGGTIETDGSSIQVSTNGTFNLETGAVLAAAVAVNSGGVFKMAGGSFDPAAILFMDGGSFELQGHSGTVFNLGGTTTDGFNILSTGNIFNGAATPATLTLNVPYYTDNGGFAPGTIVQFGGSILNGAAGSLGLAVTGGAGFGLGLSSNSNSYSGPTSVSATLQAFANGAFSPNSAVTMFAGGVLDASTFAVSIASLAGTAGTVNVSTGGTLTIGGSTSTTYSGVLTGGGTLIKTLAGNLTLTGASTYTGSFTATGGQLILQNNISASAVTANSGATVEFNTATFNGFGAQILANSGSTIEYLGSTISNAFLRGIGTHTILAGATSTFNGITTFNSTTLIQNGPAIFNNFSNGGTVTNNATLTFNGGTNSGTGILNINNVVNTQDFGSSGVINIAPGATLTNSISNLFLLGGSRTFIGTSASHGGTITLAGGTTLEVNGALLVNNGTITGTTDVNFGGTAEGIGSYGPVNVTFGGTFQPGFASSGIVANGAIVTALSGSGVIDNTSTGPMTLTLTGSSTSTFSGPIQNTTGSTALAITGNSSLTLLTTPLANGTQSLNTFTGGLSIASGGSVTIGAVGALPTASTISNNGTFTINANSTAATITGSGALAVGTAAALTLAPNSGASKQSSLSLTSISTSQLNLTNNSLIIEAPDAATKLADITALAAQVLSGKNGGLWTGPGITSSIAAGDPADVSIAIADNAALGYTNFGGQSVDADSILIVPALFGDADLNGHVDLNDLNTVLNHLGTPTGAWTNGNFDNATTIDLTDLNDVLNHLGVSLAISTLTLAPATGAPEPTSLILLFTGSAALCSRRREQRCD